MIFAWDESNVEHIARHGVRPEEAEHVVRRARPPYPRTLADRKRLVWGQTIEGRYLQVIFVILPADRVKVEWLEPQDQLAFIDGAKVAYIMHAMEMTDDQKRRYRRQ